MCGSLDLVFGEEADVDVVVEGLDVVSLDEGLENVISKRTGSVGARPGNQIGWGTDHVYE